VGALAKNIAQDKTVSGTDCVNALHLAGEAIIEVIMVSNF
jgi:hypothetical protein